MRKPAEATVDAALGREISLRDGGIRALVTGRVEKLDSTYLLSAALVNPADGVTVVSFSEEAQGQEQVLAAVRRLSSRVREALGEALPLIRESEMSLAKVTTPSLRALQLFTQGYALDPTGVAEELMRQAISEDPEFASAYIHLAWTIRNQGRPEEEFLPYAQRAFELSDKFSVPERYSIRGGYFLITGQREKAAANYKARLQLDPDHVWTNRTLSHIYNNNDSSGEEALPYLLRLAQLRPNSFGDNFRAGQSLAIQMNRWREAEPYLQRAADLAETDPSAGRPQHVAWVRLYPAHRRWLEGDLEGVLDEVDSWRETLRSSSGWPRTYLAESMGGFYLALGMFEAAEEIFWLIDRPRRRDGNLFHLEYYRMDEGEGAAYLKSQRPGHTGGLAARRMARAGRLSEARNDFAALQAQAQRAVDPQTYDLALNLTQGEIALAEGNAEEAISLLQEGVSRLRSSGTSVYFRGAESLANAWERLGNLAMAVQTLEDASQQKNRAYPDRRTSYEFGGSRFPAKLYWMRVRLRLAQLYLKLDREAEAREIEAELRGLLRYADPDLWLVRQLGGLNTGNPAGTR